MLSRSKIYEKSAPQIEAKQFYIFCEGEKRETFYFYFFNRLATQIILQLVPTADGKNSPMGLYGNACTALIPTKELPEPEYTLNPGDEVWFIIDTDAWDEHIPELRSAADLHKDWYVAQSNPCFEVWLYYHLHDDKPAEEIRNWKEFLNAAIPGGFNSTKHPRYIERATAAAAANYTETDGIPDAVTTQVFTLAERFMPLIAEKLRQLSFGEDDTR